MVHGVSAVIVHELFQTADISSRTLHYPTVPDTDHTLTPEKYMILSITIIQKSC